MGLHGMGSPGSIGLPGPSGPPGPDQNETQVIRVKGEKVIKD